MSKRKKDISLAEMLETDAQLHCLPESERVRLFTGLVERALIAKDFERVHVYFDGLHAATTTPELKRKLLLKHSTALLQEADELNARQPPQRRQSRLLCHKALELINPLAAAEPTSAGILGTIAGIYNQLDDPSALDAYKKYFE